jgi:hypothetical protein
MHPKTAAGMAGWLGLRRARAIQSAKTAAGSTGRGQNAHVG